MSYDEITRLYTKAITEKHREHLEQSEKRTFILNNFDLPVLKNIGIIDSIRDFDHIEQSIVQNLGLKSILDYSNEEFDVAFSSGTKAPKDVRTRKYFIGKAKSIFKLINNPNGYKRIC